MNNLIRDLILKNYVLLMTIVGFFSVSSMVIAVKEILHYKSIETNISYQIEQQNKQKEKIAFEKHFLIPYLESSSALFFYKHENSILTRDEYIIHIDKKHALNAKQITQQKIEEREIAWKKFYEKTKNYILNN